MGFSSSEEKPPCLFITAEVDSKSFKQLRRLIPCIVLPKIRGTWPGPSLPHTYP